MSDENIFSGGSLDGILFEINKVYNDNGSKDTLSPYFVDFSRDLFSILEETVPDIFAFSYVGQVFYNSENKDISHYILSHTVKKFDHSSYSLSLDNDNGYRVVFSMRFQKVPGSKFHLYEKTWNVNVMELRDLSIIKRGIESLLRNA